MYGLNTSCIMHVILVYSHNWKFVVDLTKCS